jgi:hypothetical protein
MRSLRRAIEAYWYATLEDPGAVIIEATNAALYIHILDETVFQDAHGAAYEDYRDNHTLGLVSLGLELIRNCETHSPISYDDLVRVVGLSSVPLDSEAPLAAAWHRIYEWAPYADLPGSYVDLPPGARLRQKHARAKAQHGYRQGVQNRQVTETLFDAVAFFEFLDPRLVGSQPPAMQWAYSVCEIPSREPRAEDDLPEKYLARPMGLDAFELTLPALGGRSDERRSAGWPTADKWFKARVKEIRGAVPRAKARQVQARVIDDVGKSIAYAGYTDSDVNRADYWVDRCQQVWKDIGKGYRYFVVDHDQQIAVRRTGQNRVQAVGREGVDLLPTLPLGDREQLTKFERYPDLYVRMRLGGAD